MGERIALYFAYLDQYFQWLLVPSLIGVVAYFAPTRSDDAAPGGFSFSTATLGSLIINLWAMVFIEYWERREKLLATLWDVRHCSRLKLPRPEFQADSLQQEDSGDTDMERTVKHYSPWKRWRTKLLWSYPILTLLLLVLALILCVVFTVEIYVTDMAALHLDHAKSVLGYAPTILYVLLIPVFTKVYTLVAKKLNAMEVRALQLLQHGWLSLTRVMV